MTGERQILVERKENNCVTFDLGQGDDCQYIAKMYMGVFHRIISDRKDDITL